MERKPIEQKDTNILEYLKNTFAEIRKQQHIYRDQIFKKRTQPDPPQNQQSNDLQA